MLAQTARTMRTTAELPLNGQFLLRTENTKLSEKMNFQGVLVSTGASGQKLKQTICHLRVTQKTLKSSEKTDTFIVLKRKRGFRRQENIKGTPS